MSPAANENHKKRKATAGLRGDSADGVVHSPSKSGGGGTSTKKLHADTIADQRASLWKQVQYSPWNLETIQERMKDLFRRVPPVPDFTAAAPSSSSMGVKEESPVVSHDSKEKASVNTESQSPVDSARCTAHTVLPHPTLAGSTIPEWTPSDSPAHSSNLYDKTKLREWAMALSCIIEEFNLLVACIAPATYQWGTDRSGASEQNLSILSSELVRSQEQISNRVTARLNEVLSPVVTLVMEKTVTTRQQASKDIDGGGVEVVRLNGYSNENDGGGDNNMLVEVKHNYFRNIPEDPDYLHVAYVMLARNAPLLRQVMLSNLDKLIESIKDYLQALHKDNQAHDSRSGFVY